MLIKCQNRIIYVDPATTGPEWFWKGSLCDAVSHNYT